MKFGIQNSVVAWDDPWHLESSKTLMRTGDGQYFPSQEPTPGREDFIDFIRNEIGVDFLLQHVMPCEPEIEEFIGDMERFGMDYLLGNEFGNANRICSPGTNRYDVPLALVERAKRSKRFLGLLYDETEHLQMNNRIYGKQFDGVYQWVDPGEMNVEEIERAFVKNVSEFVRERDCDVYAETLFATMNHAFNRAGGLVSFKILQCVYSPVHFAVALGACRQYSKKVCITADVWGPDVGEWFTRLWGLPGHSPKEFENALKMGYYFAPDLMFVENCDPLITNRGGTLRLLEFGKIYRDFLAEFRGRALPYSARDAKCDIAVIRSDDGVFNKTSTFFGGGPYGSKHIQNDRGTNSFFDVMHALSFRTITDLSSTLHFSNVGFPCTMFPRDEEAIASFPWENGRRFDGYVHHLFYPFASALVFDAYADDACLEESRAVIVCGSYLSDQTVAAIGRKAAGGVPILAGSWFRERLRGIEGVRYFDDFLCDEFFGEVRPFLGSEREWTASFADCRLTITNPSGDGDTLEFNLKREGEK